MAGSFGGGTIDNATRSYGGGVGSGSGSYTPDVSSRTESHTDGSNAFRPSLDGSSVAEAEAPKTDVAKETTTDSESWWSRPLNFQNATTGMMAGLMAKRAYDEHKSQQTRPEPEQKQQTTDRNNKNDAKDAPQDD